MYSARVHITLNGGVDWIVAVQPDALKKVNGLPSGKVVTMERKTGDVQKQQVLIRPYYRRLIDNELHIFAVQVMPNEEARHGK